MKSMCTTVLASSTICDFWKPPPQISSGYATDCDKSTDNTVTVIHNACFNTITYHAHALSNPNIMSMWQLIMVFSVTITSQCNFINFSLIDLAIKTRLIDAADFLPVALIEREAAVYQACRVIGLRRVVSQ